MVNVSFFARLYVVIFAQGVYKVYMFQIGQRMIYPMLNKEYFSASSEQMLPYLIEFVCGEGNSLIWFLNDSRSRRPSRTNKNTHLSDIMGKLVGSFSWSNAMPVHTSRFMRTGKEQDISKKL